MKRLVFHMGAPKTGSSAIQIFLARNHDALISKSVDYLKIGQFSLGSAGEISSGNGAFLARCLLRKGAPGWLEDSQPHMEAFVSAVKRSKSDVGIVSSETFISADDQGLSALIGRLQALGITTQCFYFIRSQVQLLCSGYIQQVKRSRCVEDPVRNIARTYKNMRFLNYYSLLKRMEKIFGNGNVLCRTYEETFNEENGLNGSLLDALQIEFGGLDFKSLDVNTSMSPREVAIMRLLNKFAPRMKFSDLIVANAVQRGSGASGQIHNFLPHDFVDEVEAHFESENTSLATEYFNRINLFPPIRRQDRPDNISLEGLSASELLEFFGGLFVRFDGRLASIEEKVSVSKART